MWLRSGSVCEKISCCSISWRGVVVGSVEVMGSMLVERTLEEEDASMAPRVGRMVVNSEIEWKL